MPSRSFDIVVKKKQSDSFPVEKEWGDKDINWKKSKILDGMNPKRDNRDQEPIQDIFNKFFLLFQFLKKSMG